MHFKPLRLSKKDGHENIVKLQQFSQKGKYKEVEKHKNLRVRIFLAVIYVNYF
jgi:hypothetical protein